MSMCFLLVGMSVFRMYACYLWRPEDSVRSVGTGVRVGYVPPCRCWGLNPLLLTGKPSLPILPGICESNREKSLTQSLLTTSPAPPPRLGHIHYWWFFLWEFRGITLIFHIRRLFSWNVKRQLRKNIWSWGQSTMGLPAVFVTVVHWNTSRFPSFSHPIMLCLWLSLSCNSSPEYLQQRTHDPQGLKYLLSGSLQRKFANLWPQGTGV